MTFAESVVTENSSSVGFTMSSSSPWLTVASEHTHKKSYFSQLVFCTHSLRVCLSNANEGRSTRTVFAATLSATHNETNVFPVPQAITAVTLSLIFNAGIIALRACF